jgi:ribosomal protein S18 acetylase RimI-like enzyme
MDVLRAGIEDAASVMALIARCREKMQADGSDQWDHVYPNLEVIETDARAGTLFLVRDSDEVIASVCLNEVQAPEYAPLPWRYAGRALVVHRLCVHPARQGAGLARRLMDFTENFAAENGYPSIRLDTYIGNGRALELYDRRGYQRVGQVVFARRRLRFECFEKAIFPK